MYKLGFILFVVSKKNILFIFPWGSKLTTKSYGGGYFGFFDRHQISKLLKEI
jgi:hypothetical protein